jgi:curli biogenesis system outer membrane secretion channel CsgG
MTALRTAFALTLLAGLWLAAPSAHADRAPTKAERAAIKPVALEACRSPVDDCEFRGARVSTANARYAWGNAVGEGFSGALLKRPTRHSRRFRVIASQGGGIGECSYWRKRAPRAVLRDLRIRGLVGDSGEVRNCGKRR